MKKGIAAQTLVWILFLTIGFLVIASLLKFFFFSAEGKTAEAICRGSVVARHRTGIDTGIPGVGEKEVAPLLCKSQSIDIGEDMTEEQVKKELADLMTRCWWMYGEGMVENVFKGTKGFDNECGICYMVNIKKWKEYEEDIKLNDFIIYLADTVYKVRENHDSCKMFGGFCVENEEECEKIAKKEEYDFKKYFRIDDNTKCNKDDKICCYSPYGCLNKGGICLEKDFEGFGRGESGGGGVGGTYELYGEISKEKQDLYDCPFGECNIKGEENYWSYLNYIQSYGGNGVIQPIFIDEDVIMPGETYAITFGTPTNSCEWCTKIGLKGAQLTAATLGLGILACANPAAKITCAPIGIPALKASGILFSASVASYGVSVGVTEAAALFEHRDISTIYFSKLKDAEEKCSIKVD